MNSKPSPRGIQDWKVAEENATAWMRYWGFQDACVTGPGTDAGVDVRSARALAQVKFQGNAVGRPAVQNLVGARGPQHSKALLFFSNAGYAATAVDEANRSGVALFRYDVATGEMATANSAALRLIAATPDPTSVRALPPARSGGTEPKKARGIGAPLFWATLCTISAVGLAQGADSGDGSSASIIAVVALACWVMVFIRLLRKRRPAPAPRPSALAEVSDPPVSAPDRIPIVRDPAGPQTQDRRPTIGEQYVRSREFTSDPPVVSKEEVRRPMPPAETMLSRGDVSWFDYRASSDELVVRG